MSQVRVELSRIGPFALEERLGDPPADNVFRSVHIERRQSFAVRVLPPEVVSGPFAHKTFQQEVAALKQLVHPHIVRCYGGSIDQGHAFLVLELVKGESVAERMAHRGRLPWEAAVEITRQLCRAVGHAHDRKIVHERLSPSKLLLAENGNLKLCGFGSAWADRYAGRTPHRLPLDAARYLAVEQLSGSFPVTCRSDLYSIGAALFAMVTGRAPFTEATTLEALMQSKEGADPPRVSAFEFDTPVWLDVVVQRLLAPVPTDRYGSASELLAALDEAKRNVQAGVSTAQRVLAARQANVVPSADREALDRIRRIRVRKKDNSPFYQRAWFLAACLAAVLAAMAWAVWPASESELYRQAAVLMASEDPVDWYRAQEEYLLPLTTRFPDGKYAAEVQVWLDQIAMEQAENKLRLHVQLGKAPTSEAERLYAEAWRYEQFGDRITALARYRALINLLGGTADQADRPFLNLARRRIKQITDGGLAVADRTEFDRAQFVRDHLSRADELVQAGMLVEAMRIWESIVSLYAGNRELEPLVAQAREKMDGQDQQAHGP